MSNNILRRMVYTQGNYFDELYLGMTCEEFEESPCYLELPVI